ncbi:MAG: lipid IV(A) 3-deoxy-D-manno-octulosonic acid transferase [Gammaproteobacteria bacterium]|nr:lipid IV(A) 3-deoxy-D-manno-octulosonic acid transferase [Gammaproteobacteria bacterium]MDH3373353.1 lipid IV(A) 3-deoxy-D-manno-octulosonic acid transferase [Gammaproteobacteria bacterium]MDH3408385.1 lipid IV(A) 3-deoxy-D-manno-octulosonic acid transferase [Gammaproteobacteria bacterium]MDH3553097.1 lipid IV(A) 3-deoxy-D-manno-octulosonic acid transferase [Gammaproteobacteria bacterium]
MRLLYNLLVYLLQIPVAAYWLIRSIINSRYKDRIGQRFGIGYPKLDRSIWIHAVSVGEVQASIPLIRSIEERFPGHRILISTGTPTGAERVQATFGDTVSHCYIPLEMPIAVDRFFASVNPELALIMETEIWPNLYKGCGTRDIPLVLVSARISPRSVTSYRRFLPLFRETLSHGIIIAAQSEADAERFRMLGASPARTRVTGNIKFDIELPPELTQDGKELRQKIFGERPVWVAASTHDQEEQQVLAAHRLLLQTYPDLLLVLVPRHPERFATVKDLARKSRFRIVARTEQHDCDAATQVFVGDTMGELPLFYAASDIAFVGGSLVPVGGHNLLEPAALGLPVISGPYVYNAQDIADMFVELGACHIVSDPPELAAAVDELLADAGKAAKRGKKGQEIVERNRGALSQLLGLLDPLIDKENLKRSKG